MDLGTAVPWAEGASGRVLKVRDEESGRDLAIKLLRYADSSSRARLQREADNLRKLDHPNICPIFDVVEYNGEPALVMPFIDGQPLDEALLGAGRDAVYSVMLQVVDALATAHSAGILHRDLKPGNILVQRKDGQLHAVVLDFGLARQRDDQTLTAEGQILGTPGYMSPEQARGEPATERSDIYAIGAVLYRLFTGVLPHDGDNSAEILVKTVTRDSPLLLGLPNVSTAAARVIQQCLERDPANRYPSAAALRSDLQALRDRTSVSARSLGLSYRLRRRVRANPAIYIGMTVVLLGLSTAAWLGIRDAVADRKLAADARDLEQRTAVVENAVELVFAKPLHSVSDEIDALSQPAIELAETLASDADGTLRAAALAASGRLFALAGRTGEAIDRLTEAWEAGLKEQDVALKLAQLHLGEYVLAIDAASRASPDEVDALRQKADETHLRVARLYLENVGDSALKRSLQLRFADVADSPSDFSGLPESTSPWPVPELLAQTGFLFEQVTHAAITGRNQDAMEWYTLAAYRADALLEIARSHPEGWRLRCLLESRRIELTLTGSAPANFDPIPCENLLIVDPASTPRRLAVAEVFVRQARARLSRGADPSTQLERADAVVVDLDDGPEKRRLRAVIAATRVHAQQISGETSADLFSTTLDLIREALAVNPNDPGLLADFVSVTNVYTAPLYARGEDVDSLLAEASALLDEGLKHRPDAVLLHLRSITVKTDRAYYGMLAGRDVGAILEDAVRQGREAAQRFPDHLSIRNAYAMAARTLAEFQELIGRDPRAAAEESIATYTTILEEQPDRFFTRFNMIGPYLSHVRWEISNGLAPSLLTQSRMEVEDLVARASNPDDVAVNVAAVLLLELRSSVLSDTWDAAVHRQLQDRIDVALKSEYDRTVAQVQFAELALVAARYFERTGALDASVVLSDLEVIAQALDNSPKLAPLQIYGAQLAELARRNGINVPDRWGSLEDELTELAERSPIMRDRVSAILQGGSSPGGVSVASGSGHGQEATARGGNQP